MQSKAKTVEAYLAELPDDRRRAIEAVRGVLRKNLDKDFEEGVQYGMISYFVPHRVFPAGYHCDPSQPLMYAALGSQKNHMALYLMCVYGHSAEKTWFEQAWRKTGKKLDMGKACLRFKKLEDLALEVIGEAVGRVSVKKYLERYLAVLNRSPEERRAAREEAMKRKAAAQGRKLARGAAGPKARAKDAKKKPKTSK